MCARDEHDTVLSRAEESIVDEACVVCEYAVRQ